MNILFAGSTGLIGGLALPLLLQRLPDDAPFLPCFCSGSHASGRYADGVNDRQHHDVLESLA